MVLSLILIRWPDVIFFAVMLFTTGKGQFVWSASRFFAFLFVSFSSPTVGFLYERPAPPGALAAFPKQNDKCPGGTGTLGID